MAVDVLADIDERLLAAVTGQETEAVALLSARQQVVEQYLQSNPALPELEAIQRRTRQLEEKFFHWRRTSIMELAAIEQHLRYLSELNQLEITERTLSTSVSVIYG